MWLDSASAVIKINALRLGFKTGSSTVVVLIIGLCSIKMFSK
jgi:hypothetical protein